MEFNLTVPHLWLATSDGPGPDGACLLVPAEDFGDAAVGHPQLARDDARTNAVMGHLHDLVPNVVWKRSPVNENTPKLVNTTLTQRSGDWAAENIIIIIIIINTYSLYH